MKFETCKTNIMLPGMAKLIWKWILVWIFKDILRFLFMCAETESNQSSDKQWVAHAGLGSAGSRFMHKTNGDLVTCFVIIKQYIEVWERNKNFILCSALPGQTCRPDLLDNPPTSQISNTFSVWKVDLDCHFPVC